MSLSWETFLQNMGYKEYPHPDANPNRRLFQRTFRVEQKEGESRKRAVNVHAWDLRHLSKNIKGLSFEVESTFETDVGRDGVWAAVKFYSISEGQLIELLPTLHHKLESSFFLLEGKYQ